MGKIANAMLIKAGNVSKVNLSVMEAEKRNGKMERGNKGKKRGGGRSRGEAEGQEGRGQRKRGSRGGEQIRGTRRGRVKLGKEEGMGPAEGREASRGARS